MESIAPATSKGKKIRGVDVSLIIEGSRKRQRVHTSPDNSGRTRWTQGWAYAAATDPAGFEEVRKRGTTLYDKICNQRDLHEPERFLYLDFMRLPSRTDYPDYYELIKKPIDLATIRSKLDKLEYQSVADVKEDLNQTFVNAKRYNAPGSDIFLDAKRLHKVLKDTFANWNGEDVPPEEDDDDAESHRPSHLRGSSSGPRKRGPTLKPWLRRKLDELVREVDPEGRRYADSFWTLPDPTQWAEYHKIVTTPLAFDTIHGKIDKRIYTTVQEFVDDVELLFNNALLFNAESSQIWNDARHLQSTFQEVMRERPPEFVPPRTYNTARKRREAERRAQGLPVPSHGTSKRRRTSHGVSGSEPPEGSDDDEESDYDGEEEEERGPTGTPRAGSSLDLPMLAAVPSQRERLTPGTVVRSPQPVREFRVASPEPTAASPLPSHSRLDSPMPFNLTGAASPSLSMGQNGATSMKGGDASAPADSVPAPAPAVPTKTKRLVAKLPADGEIPLISFFLLRPFSTFPAPSSSSPDTTPIAPPPTNPFMITTAQVRQHSLTLHPSIDRIELTPIFLKIPGSTSGEPVIRISVRGGGGEARCEEVVKAGEREKKLRTWSIHLGGNRVGIGSMPMMTTVIEVVVGGKEGGGDLETSAEVYRCFLTR